MSATIEFEVSGGEVRARASWPAGEDLSDFARVIRSLTAGGFERCVAAAVREAAERAGEPRRGELLADAVRRGARSVGGRPVVDPSDAIRLLVRSSL